MRTAIMVDGGFYRKRAQICCGEISAEKRAAELWSYCIRHLSEKHLDKKRTNAADGKPERINSNTHELYRIFYYDCPPMAKKMYNPFLKQEVDFSKTELYKWMKLFLEELKKKRKLALRLGKLAEAQAHYSIRPDIVKKLCNGSLTFEKLKDTDFMLNVDQKGVDIKIGVDIASVAYKKQVDQIVLISGDSDFVPAAKLARREGIDFILDPLHTPIKPDLFEHIDGLRTCDDRFRPKS